MNWRRSSIGRWLYKTGLFLAGFALITGCSMPLSFPDKVASSDESEEDIYDKEHSLEDFPDSIMEEGEGFYSKESTEGGDPLGYCPVNDEDWWLFYYYDFSVDYPMMKLHYSAFGYHDVTLGADHSVSSGELIRIPGSIEIMFAGSEGICGGSTEAKVWPTVTGNCVDGVVMLTIEEAWVYGPAEMTCSDGGSFYLEIPNYGNFVHPHVLFTLIENGSSMRSVHEFMGGEGFKQWSMGSGVPPILIPTPE
jgi:hypothetical protein